MGKLADAIKEHTKLLRIKTRFRDEEEELENKFRNNLEDLVEGCLSETDDDQDKEAYQWMK